MVGELPYLANTGKVKDAFIADVHGEKEVFVIHNVQIRSETQPGDTGDYYSTLVYKYIAGNYVEDARLSKYFGKGSDIENGKGGDGYAYLYPYKNRREVVDKLQGDNFRGWNDGKTSELVVARKTNIYDLPSVATRTKMYLIPGDVVTLQEIEAGWVSIVFKTKKDKEIKGWVTCEALSGC